MSPYTGGLFVRSRCPVSVEKQDGTSTYRTAVVELEEEDHLPTNKVTETGLKFRYLYINLYQDTVGDLVHSVSCDTLLLSIRRRYLMGDSITSTCTDISFVEMNDFGTIKVPDGILHWMRRHSSLAR